MPGFEQFGAARGVPFAILVLQQVLPVAAHSTIVLLFGQCAAQLEAYPVVDAGEHDRALEADLMETPQAAEQFFLARQAGSQQKQVEHVGFIFQIRALVNQCFTTPHGCGLQRCKALFERFGASPNQTDEKMGNASRQAGVMLAGFQCVKNLFRRLGIA